MATKSFLSQEEVKEAQSVLKAPLSTPDGVESKFQDFASLEFSNWLSEKLLSKLSAHPDWEATAPIALGSWSRGELSPRSDIDILFTGDEGAVRRLVSDFAKLGMRIRSRMPEDKSDWTKGVLPFDIIALLSGKGLTESAQASLDKEIERLALERADLSDLIAGAIKDERTSRAARFDSISNYLEPNLKYGPGGLRDLEQAYMIRSLFPQRFENLGNAAAEDACKHAFDVLLYYKRFFLLVRQKLHLSEGGGDILAAPEQASIAEWLGFKSNRDFMREIQKGVARVSFYADWVTEQALKPKAKVKKVNETKLTSVRDLFNSLEKDPSVLMQNRVRRAADSIFDSVPKKEQKATRVLVGKKLTEIIDPSKKEASLIALFRARLVDHCVPEFRRIVGHVQHDQYHRFSVDAHILQALRELKRIKRAPGIAGRLKAIVRKLDKKSWEILSFACLYHDIAKGREGDHSVEGKAIARHDLLAMGKSKAFIAEVEWIVEQHLVLSAAAFRENPRSPRTWSALTEQGVKGERLHRLAVFTIVDIRATNPEAWTPWKERLMHELITQLEKPETDQVLRFESALKKLKLSTRFTETLDPFLIASVPETGLSKDIRSICDLAEAKHNSPSSFLALPPLVLRTREGRTWVRFHSIEDRRGLFADYVAHLSRAGVSIRHASIATDPQYGVYDWFEVKSSKSSQTLTKLLSLPPSTQPSSSAAAKAKVKFDHVDIVRADDEEWVISFRGKDQSGALMEAARALFESGAEIRWAKVHTWGRQIDDVFAINRIKERTPEEFVQVLKEKIG